MNFDYVSMYPKLGKLINIVKPELEEIGESHGWQHVSDVMDYCFRIWKEEKANLRIILPSAVLHDIALAKKYGGTFDDHSIRGSKNCVPYLKKAGYTSKEIEEIKHCVAAHNVRYEGIEPKSIEARILIDADTLDKIDEGSFERAHKRIAEKKMTVEEFATRWVTSREKLIKEGKLWYTDTGRKIGQPLLEKALAYWKSKM